jgi:hypothetical protein
MLIDHAREIGVGVTISIFAERWFLTINRKLSAIILIIFCGLLSTGCHGRFKKHVVSVDEVSVRAITLSGPTVEFGQINTTDQGMFGAAATAFNVVQAVRGGNVAAYIAQKVDSTQVNENFVAGFREQLAGGPPFTSVDDGQGAALIQFELVRWGMEVPLGSPGVFNYEVVVRGYLASGKKFYRTSYQCYADAGLSGWVESTPFAGKNENQIKNLPAEEIQAIFDSSAYYCGKQFVSVVQRHAG